MAKGHIQKKPCECKCGCKQMKMSGTGWGMCYRCYMGIARLHGIEKTSD